MRVREKKILKQKKRKRNVSHQGAAQNHLLFIYTKSSEITNSK